MTKSDEEFVLSKDIPVIYADAFRIGYDAYKFVLDLGAIPTNSELPEFQVRVCMIADSAKTFTEMFRQAIQEYEDQ